MQTVIWVPRMSDILPTAQAELTGNVNYGYTRTGTAVVAYTPKRAVASVEGLGGEYFAAKPDPSRTAADIRGMLHDAHQTRAGITLGRSSALCYLAAPGHYEFRFPHAPSSRAAYMDAYSGGMVCAIHRGRHRNVVRYDLRRAYTWAMSYPVPTGAGVRSRTQEYRGEEALYRVNGKWRWGYDLADGDTWDWVCFWQTWRYAHEGYVSRCEGMGGGEGERLAKALCNALYGKHGEEGFLVRKPLAECVGRGWLWDTSLTTGSRREKLPHASYHAPHWAGLITARVRRKVRQGIAAGNAVLAHVDAILARRSIPTGPSMGDWREETHYRWVYVIENGLWVGRTKNDNNRSLDTLEYYLPGITVSDGQAFWQRYCAQRGINPGTGLTDAETRGASCAA